MPVVDSVPLMVCWSAKVTVATPADAGPVMARLLNVFAPVIALTFAELVLVKLTL